MEEIRWVRETNWKFESYGEGVYFCQVEYRDVSGGNSTIQRTKTISNFTDKYKNIKMAEIDKFSQEPISNIPYIAGDRVFSDILLTNNLTNCGEGLNSVVINIGEDGVYYFYTNGSVHIDNEGGILSLSGCMLVRNENNESKILYGTEDIVDYCSVRSHDISNVEIGSYVAMQFRKNESSIELVTDYHGSGKLYFYDDGRYFCASNRYHLIIETIKSWGIDVILNREKIIAMLSTGYHEMMSHNFTSECLVKNARQLYVGEYLKIGVEGVKIEHNEAHAVLSGQIAGDYEFNRLEYDESIRIASDEIKGNVRAILNRPEFTDIVFDLSGGIDSRVVFAALTAAITPSDALDRISIRIIKSQFDKDHVVANTIASFYPFSFYVAKNGRKLIPLNQTEYLSFAMEGKYFAPPTYSVQSQKTISINGFYGEVCLRPRGARSFLYGTYFEDVQNEDEFTKEMVSFKLAQSMIVDYEKYGFLVEKKINEQIKTTPGRSVAEKLENHYLNFSHSYHGSGYKKGHHEIVSFSPIKSKKLFEIYHKYYGIVPARKIAFDLIYKLNPLISVVCYENDDYNKDYIESKEKLMVSGDPVFYNASIPAAVNLDFWESSLIKLESNTFLEKSITLPDASLDTEALIYIAFLKKKIPSIFDEDFCLSLAHHAFIKKGDDLQLKTFVNKLKVISEHVRLFGTEHRPCSAGEVAEV